MKKFILATICSTTLVGCSQPLVTEDEGIGDSYNHMTEEEQPQSNVENNETVIDEDDLTIDKSLMNDTITVDGKELILNPNNIAVMVNKEVGLSSNYIPEDLVRPNVNFSFGDEDIEKAYLRQEAATALEILMNAASNEQIYLFAVSGYRSYDRQKTIYDNEVATSGVEWADKSIAIPGYSEHQTGLAMDVSAQSVGFRLTEDLGQTKEGIWLAENAHKYGFIIRYPKGKEGITGYRYEPWHIRYVGEEIAKDIYENDLTLEEYFNIVIAI